MWILGSPLREFSYFILPGLLALAVSFLFPNLGETSLFYALLGTALVDNGHVHTTLWRTYLHPAERSSHKAYLLVPISLLILFFIWHYTGAPYLWNFVVYSTLFHHVRQFYGTSKWYQSLNKRTDKYSDACLYILLILPLIAFHFRPEINLSIYSERDIFFYPNTLGLKITVVLFFGCLGAWLIHEGMLWRKGIREVNRVLSIAWPVSVYSYCFFFGENMTQILFPLFFVHGIAYFGMLGRSLHRTQASRFQSETKAIIIVIVTAFFLGGFNSYLENLMLEENERSLLLMSSMTTLLLTPLFCHYIFDAIIWKKSHREAKLVFSTNQA